MLAINLLIVWFLIRFFSTQYLIACAIAFALESFIAFYINRYWTFHSEISFSVGFRRCVVIGFYSTLAILCITYGFTHYLSMHYVSARTASTVIMGIIGYFLDMRFAFRV
jgi:putative flippase GtrA